MSTPAADASADATITIGPLHFSSLPTDLGRLSGPEEFFYDDAGSFHQASWERGDNTAGWSTDLMVSVMTREDLVDAPTLFDWYVAYSERPAADVDYAPTSVNEAVGYLTRDQVFWLVRPGLACSITIDRNRYNSDDLRVIAESAVEQQQSAGEAAGE